VESFWAGKIHETELDEKARAIRKANWLFQKQSGIEHIPSNDFSLYDQVLDTAAMVGAVPARFDLPDGEVDTATYFAMARGVKAGREGDSRGGAAAMEMTKWFDTNYHYIVPELEENQSFRLASGKPVDEYIEARSLGVRTRPVLVGPLTFLLLAKGETRPLSLLDSLLTVYGQVLRDLAEAGAEWVQFDEPCLILDLDDSGRAAYLRAYSRLAEAAPGVRLLVATYFGELGANLETAVQLPAAALHVDLVRGMSQLDAVLGRLPRSMALSLGVVDGRNIWKTDMAESLSVVERAVKVLGSERIMVAPSCSLLHVPLDLEQEDSLDDELKNWLAFAKQKIVEIGLLTQAVEEGAESVTSAFEANRDAMDSRRHSKRVHDEAVKRRLDDLSEAMLHRKSPYPERSILQQSRLKLPLLPTTTIGSFPQTRELRKVRADSKKGRLDQAQYEAFLRTQIEKTVRFQEEAGFDVLVHAEPERNDMVEYFAEQLEGFITTRNGWVQSYGSRCVKPPIIFGDIRRRGSMTVDWIRYAQSLTEKPLKGMLTGPITILQWSFARDDQPRSETCRQIALAIRDEVQELESAGIGIIQIDEPALREGLPLHKSDWGAYLRWAVDCFRLASSGVRDETQIHTHMCYSEFNDIVESMAEMDADVISIEASRSGMELLEAFARFNYPNQVGPGVYDVHSPRVPEPEEFSALLAKAMKVLKIEQIWINPDCGLKTRRWKDVEPSLKNLITAAQQLRKRVAAQI
jgi:5-methyltetrahydropteroyltriglutamate--homocysteine methyltransferase